MDTVEFIVEKSSIADDEGVVPHINGQSLVDLAGTVELAFARREGAPEIAGAYMGLPANVALYPSPHLLGEPNPLYAREEKVELLVCNGCAEPGCWPLLARVTISGGSVTWSEFEQPHRSHETGGSAWRHDGLGPFVFDLGQYSAALGFQMGQYAKRRDGQR